MASKPLHSISDAQQVGLLPQLPQSQTVLSQIGYVEDPDVLGQIRDGFQNFVETGQMWALILGFMLGFWFSGIRRG